jgi:hypothetical protein
MNCEYACLSPISRPLGRVLAKVQPEKILVGRDCRVVEAGLSLVVQMRFQIDGVGTEIRLAQEDGVQVEEEIAPVAADGHEHRVVVTNNSWIHYGLIGVLQRKTR